MEDEAFSFQDQVRLLRYPPERPGEMWVSFARNAGTFYIDLSGPDSAQMMDVLAESLRRAVEVEYHYTVIPSRLRLTSVELTAVPWKLEPWSDRPLDVEPRAHQMTDVFEGAIRSVGSYEVLRAGPEDPDPEKWFYLSSKAAGAQKMFDVLVEAMRKRLPVRVTYYTADGEVIKVEQKKK